MTRRTRRQVVTALGGVLGLAGCSVADREQPTQVSLSPSASYGYTHVQPTGNRVLTGAGSIQRVDPVEIAVGSRPAWLVALPGETGSHWTVVGADGSAKTVRVADGTATTVTDHPALPAGMPPLARKNAAGIDLVRPPEDSAAKTHPVVTDHGLLSIARSGDLVLDADGESTRWEIDALSDGRIVHVADSRYALFGDQTRRYRHGALGGVVEGGSLVIVDVATGDLVARTRVGPPQVIEGLFPLVADFDGDGEREIVLTIADSDDGARIAVYDATGAHVATGPIYGPGWRHQLCVAPFTHQPELAVTRKPHVDQVVEFYRLSDGALSITAEIPNVSTHTYGSINTDGAVAADLDGDGQIELLVPSASRDRLLAIRRTETGADVAWEVPLTSTLTTNLTGVTLSDGQVAVGAGTTDGVSIWQG